MTDAPAEKKLTGAEDVIWDLSVFYDGVEDSKIETDIKALEQLVNDFEGRYKGKVADLDAEDFVDAFKAMEAIYDIQGRLGSFASLHFSTDTQNPKYQALSQRMSELGSQMGQKMVFFDLEWNKVEDDKAQQILADPTLGEYRYMLETERRYKPYNLSEAEEQIVIEKSVTGNQAWTRFFTQLTSAFTYDWDGETVNTTFILNKHRDADRPTREKAWRKLTDKLKEKSMELTYIFNVLALDKANSDQRRGYESWISSRNLSNKAPDAVVDALVQTVTSNYDIVARQYKVKRALLGFDELLDYDRYAPLNLKESEKFYTWDEAKKIVLDAFGSFSPEMKDAAQLFFDKNWIHAPVTQAKRGGAFASPTVATAHPFVFVNYIGDARDVTTLAHELGHGIHMYLSGKHSGFFALYTPLTTAEMASTFAEMLVFQDLMAAEPDREIQLAMLVEKIEDTFATVFRQISMNRFENSLHTARRAEGELTTDRINELWLETQRDMFKDSVTMTDEYGYWWSYVPHFLHTPGYVYAYSFGELLVLALYEVYQEEGKSFVPKYLELLGAGDSDYPDKLLAKVGVDLNDPAFWQKGLDVLDKMVKQAESLARELYPDKFE